ncbi:MAG: PTS transporter subunit EIIB [Actinomycetaceae bacterium]|nr:PTS transporter subunit EIIB [Actinomycetaceae bacterium]MDY6143720.1 PTS transporter subunit EIIB [Arcanobacterium sp.]
MNDGAHNLTQDGALAPAQLADQIIAASGGSANVSGVDSNISRIELSVKDSSQVDVEALRRLGAIGVVLQTEHVQLVFGKSADHIAYSLIDRLGIAPSENY